MGPPLTTLDIPDLVRFFGFFVLGLLNYYLVNNQVFSFLNLFSFYVPDISLWMPLPVPSVHSAAAAALTPSLSCVCCCDSISLDSNI